MIMHTKQVFSSLILGLSCAASAQAADWELARNNVDFEMYIDKSSVVIKDGIVRAWVRTSYSEPKKDQRTGTLYQSEMNLRAYNCKYRESVLIQRFLTAGDNGTGKTVESALPAHTPGREMDVVVPDTIDEVQLDVVCEAANGKIQTPPSDWRSVGRNSSLEMFLDAQSIIIKGDTVRAGVRVSFPTSKTITFLGKSYFYQSFEGLYDYDCAKREILPIKNTIFVGPDFTGKIVYSAKPSDFALAKMKAVAPQTVDANQLDVVCKYKKYKEEKSKSSGAISK